jgi:hypothetical protein
MNESFKLPVQETGEWYFSGTELKQVKKLRKNRYFILTDKDNKTNTKNKLNSKMTKFSFDFKKGETHCCALDNGFFWNFCSIDNLFAFSEIDTKYYYEIEIPDSHLLELFSYNSNNCTFYFTNLIEIKSKRKELYNLNNFKELLNSGMKLQKYKNMLENKILYLILHNKTNLVKFITENYDVNLDFANNLIFEQALFYENFNLVDFLSKKLTNEKKFSNTVLKIAFSYNIEEYIKRFESLEIKEQKRILKRFMRKNNFNSEYLDCREFYKIIEYIIEKFPDIIKKDHIIEVVYAKSPSILNLIIKNYNIDFLKKEIDIICVPETIEKILKSNGIMNTTSEGITNLHISFDSGQKTSLFSHRDEFLKEDLMVYGRDFL